MATLRLYLTNFDIVQDHTDGRKKSAMLVDSAAMTNDVILDLNLMKTDYEEDKIKDKMFDIDTITQEWTQKSNNQNRVLVH